MSIQELPVPLVPLALLPELSHPDPHSSSPAVSWWRGVWSTPPSFPITVAPNPSPSFGTSPFLIRVVQGGRVSGPEGLMVWAVA